MVLLCIYANYVTLFIFNTGQPSRFEIMDTSGNVPLIKLQQDSGNPVTHEANENDVIKLKTSNSEVVVEIRVTGYATDVDIL